MRSCKLVVLYFRVDPLAFTYVFKMVLNGICFMPFAPKYWTNRVSIIVDLFFYFGLWWSIQQEKEFDVFCNVNDTHEIPSMTHTFLLQILWSVFVKVVFFSLTQGELAHNYQC